MAYNIPLNTKVLTGILTAAAIVVITVRTAGNAVGTTASAIGGAASAVTSTAATVAGAGAAATNSDGVNITDRAQELYQKRLATSAVKTSKRGWLKITTPLTKRKSVQQ